MNITAEILALSQVLKENAAIAIFIIALIGPSLFAALIFLWLTKHVRRMALFLFIGGICGLVFIASASRDLSIEFNLSSSSPGLLVLACTSAAGVLELLYSRIDRLFDDSLAWAHKGKQSRHVKQAQTKEELESDSRLVVLATFDHSPDAHLLRMELENDGVVASVANETSAQTIGASIYGRIVAVPIEVLVFESDLELALEIKANYEQGLENQNAAPWQCRCGATVDAGFKRCWSCGQLQTSSDILEP